MSEAQRIESLAADWLARRDSGDWTDTDQQQLDAWIAASIAHRVAWLRLCKTPSPHFTQCRTFRSTDQWGCLGTAFFPRIQ